MAELVELKSDRHGSLKVAENCAVELAARQHLVNLRAAELTKAVSDFPVFLTRVSNSRRWALSAMAGFEPGCNLFVQNEQWMALYEPTGMQTYPLYLMQSQDDAKGYAVGIDEQSNVFSEDKGESLFDDKGRASLFLTRITALLEADINNDILTRQFTETLEELGLVKPVDLLVQSADDSVQTIKGLHTVDEDKLQSLPDDQLANLNKRGFLVPMHAMLISIFQLNSLIRKHNQNERLAKVKQIKLETSKDTATA